jgi:hypothetical protein
MIGKIAGAFRPTATFLQHMTPRESGKHRLTLPKPCLEAET